MNNDLFGPKVCPCCGQPIEDKSMQSAFEDFWKVWPDKKAKAQARKAWDALRPTERVLATERAASWFSAWRNSCVGASPIHASTYLRQRRFLDIDEKSQARSADRSQIVRNHATAIKMGKRHLVAMISAAQAREMVSQQLVTVDECRKVGLL